MRHVLHVITHGKHAHAPERLRCVIAKQARGKGKHAVHATRPVPPYDERHVANAAREYHAHASHHRVPPYPVDTSATRVLFGDSRDVDGILPDDPLYGVLCHVSNATSDVTACARDGAVKRVRSLLVSGSRIIRPVHALRDLVIDIKRRNAIVDESRDVPDVPDVPVVSAICRDARVELHGPKHGDNRAELLVCHPVLFKRCEVAMPGHGVPTIIDHPHELVRNRPALARERVAIAAKPAKRLRDYRDETIRGCEQGTPVIVIPSHCQHADIRRGEHGRNAEARHDA